MRSFLQEKKKCRDSYSNNKVHSDNSFQDVFGFFREGYGNGLELASLRVKGFGNFGRNHSNFSSKHGFDFAQIVTVRFRNEVNR